MLLKLNEFICNFRLNNSNTWYLYTFSKNDVISSVRKHYCALGLELGSELCRVSKKKKKNGFDQTCFRASLIHPQHIHLKTKC